jgi:putative ABC transport system permease protein
MFFLRLLANSFQRQPGRKLLAGLAVTLSVVMATAMITLANDVEDKMNRELRAIGANIIVRPAAATLDLSIPGTPLQADPGAAYIAETDLIKIKQHFWVHNILGVTPMLNGTVEVNGAKTPITGTWFAHEMKLNNENFITGIPQTHKWWRVDGSWPAEEGQDVLVGQTLAAKLQVKTGDGVRVGGAVHRVAGILTTGGAEDASIVAPLHVAQAALGLPGRVSVVHVSALTKPEDDFARRDPLSMTAAMRERWMCSPYANSIAYTINEALPSGHAEVVRAVAQNEGAVLSRISGLMLLITLCAIIAAIVAVSSSMATSLFERQREVGLLRSLGGTRTLIATLFLCEATILALGSAIVGFFGGSIVAAAVSRQIFGISVSANPALLPLIVLIAVGITALGSFFAVRRAVQVQPSKVLRGEVA